MGKPQLGEIVAVRGRPVHLLRRGRGRPVLLLHGSGGLGQEILGGLPELPGIAWIAPDRPGFGHSTPLPRDEHGPIGLAGWADALLDALGAGEVVVVAHSIAASAAVWLAARDPERVRRLVLIAPFCRPTPHRRVPGLRLAVAPVLGPFVRQRVLPSVAPWIGRRWLSELAGGPALPHWLDGFPIALATRPRAIETMAAELRAFNADMAEAERLRLRQPVLVIAGAEDRTAPADWHAAWLRRVAPDLRLTVLPGVGHAPHHAAPAVVLEALRAELGAARGRSAA